VPYSLGVDLGTTFVAAAVAHASRVEMFTLGDRSVVTPAMVYARDDGSIVTGDAAQRRAISAPDRVGREFKRRLGDPTPVMLGGAPHAVTALLGTLLGDVIARVTDTEGAAPGRIVLTHPANWGPYRRELFEEVPQVAGVAQALMVTEPEAAAAHYAATRHLRDGDTVAVYDLGGGTFDATVLRKRAGTGSVGIDILGTPEGIERLGGVDFDDAIFAHVNYSLKGALSELDMSNPQTAVALARLRQDCVAAKEALSIDTETTIPVFLPQQYHDVRLTRAEFEDMIRAPIESTIGALVRTLRSAQVEPAALSAVLLVGGSSRIPLVARMITEALNRPTLIDAHPKYAVALGAAALAGEAPVQTTAAELAEDRAERGETVAALVTSEVGGAARAAAPDRVEHDARPPVPLKAVGTAARTDQPPSGAGQDGARPADANHTPPALAGWSTEWPDATPPVPAARHRTRNRVLAAVAVLLVLAASVSYVLSQGRTPQAADVDASVAAPLPSPVVLPPPAPAPAEVPQAIAASVPIPPIRGQVAVGKTPGFVAIAPNGKFAYVANRAAGVVTVVDTAINEVVATIPIPDGPPQYLAFAPDGQRLYVSVFNDPDRSINEVAVLDTQTNTVVTTIKVGSRPYALDVMPDGSEIYVPNHDSGTVSVIDTASNALVTDIRVKPNPHWVEFSQDGTQAYTANHESNVITVIDTATRSVAAEIPVEISPHSVAVHPTRPLVANVNYDSDSVTVIDTERQQVTAVVPVGTHPQDVTWSPDGRHLYATNVDSDNMTVVSVDGYRVTATVPTGEAPTSVAVRPDGRQAYITNLNSGTLTVLDLAG
jgi:YVTN family beta-propeller protein